MAKSRFPIAELTRIVMLIVALVAIILSKDACGLAVKNLFNTVAPPVEAAADAGQIRR